jgi:hypothetical protein
LDDKLWVYGQLTEVEAKEYDGLWSAKRVENLVNSINDQFKLPPLSASMIWNKLLEENLFWTGNSLNRDKAKMWWIGWWRQSKSTRTLTIGCLKCGYRTPQLQLGIEFSIRRPRWP